MQDILTNYAAYFPSQNDQSYTLKQFIDNKSQLPVIVNITSLNKSGRFVKNLLTKNTPLLLLDIHQLDSVLAEYHRSHDGRYPSHLRRLNLTQGKMATKASTKFRSMKKLSKSLASLTAINHTKDSNDHNYIDDDDDDDDTSKQRNLVKNLNEKRSSAIPLCRIPITYRSFFELLNENDQSIEPYHKLSDLIIIEYDDNDSEKRFEKWPHAFFLRSSCSAYTKKYVTTTNENSSYLNVSSDLDSQKNVIILNDDVQILQPGQVLVILGDCYALRTGISNKAFKEQQRQSPSPLPSSSTHWIREKAKNLFPKTRRHSHNINGILQENIRRKSIPGKSEAYLKCRTLQNDIIYISLEESGLFSPLHSQTYRLKSNKELSSLDISGVFQLKDLISNFRLPISVRLLDGSISFDNIYAPGIINQNETAVSTRAKFRLLMPYNEHVIFACPLNTASSKYQKTSFPFTIIPLSINADIEIQPCINMTDISKDESFHKLLETCFQQIEQYRTEISLIHFPLQITNNANRPKQCLFIKRSLSESQVEYFDEQSKCKFHHSDDHLNNISHHTDNSLAKTSSSLRYRDSIETMKNKLPTEKDRQYLTAKRSSYYSKKKNAQQKKYSHDEYTSEDEIYEEVDKIYDYIRSGDITDDVQKIQDKEQTINLPDSITKEFQRQTSSGNCSSGQMVTRQCHPKVNDFKQFDHDFDFHSCKNDGNVDDEQAHALYVASKQLSKPITKMKRITKN